MDSFTPYNPENNNNQNNVSGNGNLLNSDKKKKNKGISCTVKNCVYHDGVNYCIAEQIAVGPTYANSVSDTVCATFKQKTI